MRLSPSEEQVGGQLPLCVYDKAIHISSDAAILAHRELIIPSPAAYLKLSLCKSIEMGKGRSSTIGKDNQQDLMTISWIFLE